MLMLVTSSTCYTANTNRSVFDSMLCPILIKNVSDQKSIKNHFKHNSYKLNSCLFIQDSTILTNGEKYIFPRSSKAKHPGEISASPPLTSMEQQLCSWLHRQTHPLSSQDEKKKSMNNFKQGTCLATII